jgi:hypothetical protein
MAWQGAVASTLQIAAKASTKPVRRNLAVKAVRQRFGSCPSLAGILGSLALLFKRQITVDGP